MVAVMVMVRVMVRFMDKGMVRIMECFAMKMMIPILYTGTMNPSSSSWARSWSELR